MNAIDIGCGGGLLSEPMSRLGAKVTGIDASEKNIYIAIGYALANVIMVVGDNENIIIDTAGSEEYQKLS